MSDLTSLLLPRLRANRINLFGLGDGFMYPAYHGQSILNIPSTICRWLDAPEIGAPALINDITAPLSDGIKRVILILMDGLALHRLQRWMDDLSTPVWSRLQADGILAPLTSITPSTTSAALTSLWTGRSPAEHGITGYEMWMKEYGVVANTIFHAPMTFKGDFGTLTKAGFDPKAYLPYPTMGAHLAQAGVETYAAQNHGILDSGLSQMFFKDVKTQGFMSAADLWINLRNLVETPAQKRQYIWVYWSEVDTFSHYYGPDDERPAAEFANFSAAFERLFLDRLSPAARKGTLLILTSDHGAITTAQSPHYDLRNHPSLTRRLHIQPTGENRLAFLYMRPGQTEALREYVDRTWPNQFTQIDPAFAVEAGLFGPGESHPRLLDRLGDLILAARSNAYLWWHDKENHLVGRHGGLHPEEMLAPFLAIRL
jgi:predicted AlkP superfamily pyrophosphatase or phosphodiesterase